MKKLYFLVVLVVLLVAAFVFAAKRPSPTKTEAAGKSKTKSMPVTRTDGSFTFAVVRRGADPGRRVCLVFFSDRFGYDEGREDAREQG